MCTRRKASINFNPVGELDETSLISLICKNTTVYLTDELFTKNKKRVQKQLEKTKQGKQKALLKMDEILDLL